MNNWEWNGVSVQSKTILRQRCDIWMKAMNLMGSYTINCNQNSKQVSIICQNDSKTAIFGLILNNLLCTISLN